MKATHKSKKTGKLVLVEREGSTVIVKKANGAFLRTYERAEMKDFYSRYESLVAGKVKKEK